MSKFWHIISISLALTTAMDSFSAQPNPEQRGIEFFRVVPGNCIVKSAELCQTRFRFSWRLFRAEEACIFLDSEADAIYCSHEQAEETDLILAVSGSKQFRLILTKVPQYALSKQVKVLVIGDDIRLRRRHLWSFL